MTSPITRSKTSIASSAATCGITEANATRVARRRLPPRSATAWARAAFAKRTSAWSRPGGTWDRSQLLPPSTFSDSYR
ncbi:hypothetical protein WB401_03760 [Streptomyces brasiliscabiei]|uniref:Uncharacterized protein n=1 Tax=Streptomyces brasiliscabiei TaxID=2736302 RepID=A0ABU8GGG7_9ACTN